MSEINGNNNKLRWLYAAGFIIILALPILIIEPYFFPADWGKTIVFRSIVAVLLFLFAFQFLFRKNNLKMPSIKKNITLWMLSAVFFIYLLASIFSADPNFSFWGSPYRGGGFVNFAFYCILAVMAFIFLRDDSPSKGSWQAWEKTWLFSVFVGLIVSLVGILQYYGIIIYNTRARPVSTLGNTDILAAYLLFLFFIALYAGIKEKVLWKKIFYFSSLAVFFYTILITGSRAAYLGLLMGGIYFLLFYPKKMIAGKIGVIVILAVTCGIVFYANTAAQYPKFLENNKLFKSIEPRLSIKRLTEDPRFAAWQIGLNALKSKPLLGYGPENFSVGFDKYYNPSLPYLNKDVQWYDRAHNIILQTGSDAGFLGIIAYLALFFVLLWQLQKLKSIEKESEKKEGLAITAHGIQAALISYLVANFFGFDSFATYTIFFLLIGYSMHLIYGADLQVKTQNIAQKNTFWKSACICVLFLILLMFLWQYNFVPLRINAEINNAGDLADQKQCDKALGAIERLLPEHSFLDSYIRLEYIGFEETCMGFYPKNNLVYVKKSIELLSEAVKMQPLYTRYWLRMGNLSAILAEQEKDAAAKNNLIKQASDCFYKAFQLAPKHQEIFTGMAKLGIDASDYKTAKTYSEECIKLNPSLGGCYWYLGLTEIYLKDINNANKNIQTAGDKKYNINSELSLAELANAYSHISDYQNSASVYEKLIAINPNMSQFHSSLAFIYKELGQYGKARQEAMTVLKLSPELKESVDAFLNSLP